MKVKGFVKQSMTFMLIAVAALLVSAGIVNAAGTITLMASEPATIYYTTNGASVTTPTTLAQPATLPPIKQINPNIQQLSPSYPATPPPTSVQHSKYVNGVPVMTPQNVNNSKQVRTAPLSSGKVKSQGTNPSVKSTDPAKTESQNGNKSIPAGKLKPYVSPKKRQPPKPLTIKQEQQP